MKGFVQLGAFAGIGFFFAVFLTSVVVITSVDRYTEGFEEAEIRVAMAKKELLKSTPKGVRPGRDGLMQAHNVKYQEVGEDRWEQSVKPTFMSRMIFRTIEDSGNLFPGLEDVIQWSRKNPRESVRMLEEIR